MSSALEWVALASGPSGLAFWGKGLLDRKVKRAEATHLDADTAKVFTEIAVGLVAPLEARIAKLERENSAAFAYIRTLLSFIRVHLPAKTPPPPPEELGIQT